VWTNIQSGRARYDAGPSTTVDAFLQLAKYLKFEDDELILLRVALVGWLLRNGDHSYDECMLPTHGDDGFGMPYTPIEVEENVNNGRFQHLLIAYCLNL
jgi:hypothetical protein